MSQAVAAPDGSTANSVGESGEHLVASPTAPAAKGENRGGRGKRKSRGNRGSRGRAKKETSAGGVVYRSTGKGPLFLLIRDSYSNWGFPKGHLENDESPEDAALREVQEETGLEKVSARGMIDTIDWHFRFRGRLIHKVCHFYLMETESVKTKPQRDEGITACRWLPIDKALKMISYGNAREVLQHAYEKVQRGSSGTAAATASPPQLPLPLPASDIAS